MWQNPTRSLIKSSLGCAKGGEMSELKKSKKELLACLDEWIKYIKKHLGIDSHSFQAYQQIYQIIQNQPEVTEKWMEEKARRLSKMTHRYDGYNTTAIIDIESAKTFIRSLVGEIQ